MSVTPPEDGGVFSSGAADAASSGACKGGLYTGTFTGNYTSSLTIIGLPVPVTGELSMTLTESHTGGGEFPVYTIQNGVISGLVYGVYPFRCDMVGTLDCGSEKLVGGGVTCVYCVGPVTGNLDDGGTCASGGHFEGPLNANYDSATFSFVDGTWNGSEEAVLADGGMAEGGTINDAGVYIGPGNYGGSGTWTAAFGNGDP